MCVSGKVYSLNGGYDLCRSLSLSFSCSLLLFICVYYTHYIHTTINVWLRISVSVWHDVHEYFECVYRHEPDSTLILWLYVHYDGSPSLLLQPKKISLATETNHIALMQCGLWFSCCCFDWTSTDSWQSNKNIKTKTIIQVIKTLRMQIT